EATDLANGQLPGLNEANLLLPEILAKPAEPSFFRCHFSDIYGKLSTSRLSTYIMRVHSELHEGEGNRQAVKNSVVGLGVLASWRETWSFTLTRKYIGPTGFVEFTRSKRSQTEVRSGPAQITPGTSAQRCSRYWG